MIYIALSLIKDTECMPRYPSVTVPADFTDVIRVFNVGCHIDVEGHF